MKRFTSSILLSTFIAISAWLPQVSFAATVTTKAPPTAQTSSSPQLQITNLTVDNMNDFVLEPGKIELNVNPGDVITKYISVTNQIKSSMTFKISVEDFVGSKNEDQPVVLLGNDKSPYSFKDNITPAVSTVALNFGDRVTIPITITVPKDAQPGGYYSSVIVSDEPTVDATAAGQAPGGVHVISRVGTLFFIVVNGPVNTSGNVEDFRIKNSRPIYNSAPSNFEILFNNTGTIHLVPYGDVMITNFFGKQIADLPVDAYFAMPDSLRYRDVFWNDNHQIRIGMYTATLQLHNGYNSTVDIRKITFWIFPWRIVVPALIIIIFAILIGYLFFTRFEFRRKKK